MRDYRNFFASKNNAESSSQKSKQKSAEGKVHVAFYSDVFAKVSGRFIATNSEYSGLKNEIMDAIEPYGTKEDIQLTVFESEESSEFGRESTLIGFNKYMKGCITAKLRNIWKKIAVFGTFFLIGVFIMIAVFAIPAVRDNIITWVAECLKIFANVFIWQFCGFLSFDFSGEIHTLHKYRQILERINFEFKHFE